MTKTVTLRIDAAIYRLFKERAGAVQRTLSNYIEVAALEYARESAFADDAEMADIASNRSLIKRLRAGSLEARKMKGRFVG